MCDISVTGKRIKSVDFGIEILCQCTTKIIIIIDTIRNFLKVFRIPGQKMMLCETKSIFHTR